MLVCVVKICRSGGRVVYVLFFVVRLHATDECVDNATKTRETVVIKLKTRETVVIELKTTSLYAVKVHCYNTTNILVPSFNVCTSIVV